MSLDESIDPGQPGHISDHEVIHRRINRQGTADLIGTIKKATGKGTR